MSIVPFAIYYAGDAYSTANKIMGRQSAGKAFIKGVARTWPQSTAFGIGLRETECREMLQQLMSGGFTGQLQWNGLPDWSLTTHTGTLYYPAPPPKDLAASRNLLRPDAFSIMGVTHTLSSANAIDQVSDLVLPPFKPWDALICTSRAAHSFVSGLQSEVRSWWQAQTGANRFVQVQLPVIPLGVDCPAYATKPYMRKPAREALKLKKHETVFLFAGRLSFHAKANPAPVYQALEQVAKQTPVVCIEAGVFPNKAIQEGYQAAQKALAPSVRFIWVDGNNETRYRQAWQGADIFVSLSDNIQETFGLTPVEAMAAGLPVVVSDWNGYKDTVRDGIDGYRIPTVMPPAGVGGDLALRHALGIDTYDFYIGRTSLATVVDPNALAQALLTLALDTEKRRTMGAAGAERAKVDFDWPVILQRYAELAGELATLRAHYGNQSPEPWPTRADPFARFAHFSTATLAGNSIVIPQPDAEVRLKELFGLSMANYAFDAVIMPRETINELLKVSLKNGNMTVNALLTTAGHATQIGARGLMWLWKFGLIQVG